MAALLARREDHLSDNQRLTNQSCGASPAMRKQAEIHFRSDDSSKLFNREIVFFLGFVKDSPGCVENKLYLDFPLNLVSLTIPLISLWAEAE